LDTSSGGNGASLVTLNWLRSIGFWPSKTSMPAGGGRPGPFRGGVDGGMSASLEGLAGDEPGTLQTSSSRACEFRLVEAGFGRACVLRTCGRDESRKSQISFSRPSLPVASAPSKRSRSVAGSPVIGFFALGPFVAGSSLLLSRGRSSSKSESSKPSSSESGTTPDSLQFFMISDGGVHKGMAQVSIAVTGSLGVVRSTM
jgi:hypothetical protein